MTNDTKKINWIIISNICNFAVLFFNTKTKKINMEILNSFLAQIFEKFKAGNPTLAAILAVILVLLNLNIDPILASLNISGALASTIKVVLLSVSAILGSKTYQFLPENAKEIKSKKDVKL